VQVCPAAAIFFVSLKICVSASTMGLSESFVACTGTVLWNHQQAVGRDSTWRYAPR
jgi:hypothetical protein